MTDSADIKKRLHELLRRQAGCEAGDEGDEGDDPETLMEEVIRESIEILDLTFHIEKEFGVRLSFQKMFAPEVIVSNPDGTISQPSLAELQRRLPMLDVARLGPRPTWDDARRLLTFAAVAEMIHVALEDPGSLGEFVAAR